VITGSSPFAGDIISNDNDGTVWLIDTTTGAGTEIASGGTRGDYVGMDGTNGSLFLSQTNEIFRLGCGDGCGFVGVSGVPGTIKLGHADHRLRRRWLHGLSPQLQAGVDGCLIHDHQV
jgi:hypothetical protein